jgi:hypothetical protein
MDDLSSILASLQFSDFPSAKIKIDQYFSEWLLSEGAEIIELLSEKYSDHEDSYSSESVSSSYGTNNSKPPTPSVLHGTSIVSPTTSSQQAPPRSPNKKSPKKRTQSEMQSSRISPSASTDSDNDSGCGAINPSLGNSMSFDDSESGTQLAARRKTNFDTIPVFYIPGQNNRANKYRIEEDQLAKRLPDIEAFFKPFPQGIPVDRFVHVTKRLCGIPSFFNLPLCKRINERFGDEADRAAVRAAAGPGRNTTGIKVRLKTFLKYWEQEIEPYDRIERFFRTIKQPEAECAFKDDFVPFLQELLHFHPGLDFLDSHEEFQRKYALTVITRIFYKVNTSRSGKLSLREVRNSNLMNEVRLVY